MILREKKGMMNYIYNNKKYEFYNNNAGDYNVIHDPNLTQSSFVMEIPGLIMVGLP